MHTLCEIAGIDGDVWSLEQDGDEQYLMHSPDPASIGPMVVIPIDEHVLVQMWRASKAVAVVLASDNVVAFPQRTRMASEAYADALMARCPRFDDLGDGE